MSWKLWGEFGKGWKKRNAYDKEAPHVMLPSNKEGHACFLSREETTCIILRKFP